MQNKSINNQPAQIKPVWNLKPRYWLFGGEAHYAGGGFEDFLIASMLLQELLNMVESESWVEVLPKAEHCYEVKWWHIYDSQQKRIAVSYTHLRAHETEADLVCRLLLEKKKK